MKRLFALDHNFPVPIVKAISPWMPEAELVPLGDIDRRLPALANDWEVLLALHVDARHWDGMITTDSGILRLPRELSVLMQTRLTLVVAQAAGHDPLKATGLVLSHLPWICQMSDPERAQVWTLRSTKRPHDDPWSLLGEIARRRGVQTKALYDGNRLGDEELRRGPLRRRGPRGE